MIVLIHFKHIKLLVDTGLWRTFNCITFFVGSLAGFGLYLIGSFQVTISVDVFYMPLCHTEQDILVILPLYGGCHVVWGKFGILQ